MFPIGGYNGNGSDTSPNPSASWFIQVAVPFNTIMNFNYPNEDGISVGFPSLRVDCGNLCFTGQASASPGGFEVFAAVGDDFRYGIFRPPLTSFYGFKVTGSSTIRPYLFLGMAV
jgi:hypothetical protein